MKTIYALRVFNKKTRAFVAVYGANANGVVKQDKKVYGMYDAADFHIERLVERAGDYLDFPGALGLDATEQAWAEFIFTPGGK